MTYVTIRRLGRGGMGVVDLARDENGREVALKRLSLHGTPEEVDRARQRIRREAEVLQQLDHPGIVTLLEVVDDGDDLILVMDYLPGGTLAGRVGEDGPLPSAQVRELGDRLLDALAVAHRQGVVHRDIKPANVLFDADGNAALADFGAAIHRDATPGLTASEMVVGTPGFMSPEQARGEPATAASDVFSLGATLAFAASGEGPFGTADPRVLMLRAAAGRTDKPPKSLSPDLRRRIGAMLDRDPTRRPTAAEARGGVAGTHQRTAARRPVLGRSRRRVALGALMGVLTVGAAVAVLTGGDDNQGRLTPESTTSTTEACEDLPFQPCGDEPAPNTDGERCLEGYADFDGEAANGCEAEPDGLRDRAPLLDEVRGNLVPQDDVDEFLAEVTDNAQLLGDGEVRFNLTAPKGVSQRLTVLSEDGDEELGTVVSSDGVEATVTLREPRFGQDDSTTLLVRVESFGAERTAARYRLTKRGSY